ncbi:hypothetical protein ABTL67_20005, partial [Acinetobacter baumannii]
MKKLTLAFSLLLLAFSINAQSKFSDFKNYPFPTQLCSAAKGSRIAWAIDEQGKRNIYVAEAPDYKPKRITDYDKD